jgi:hypothetical protein
LNHDDPLDPARALTPVAIRVNETRVRRGFMPKLRRVAAKIPFASDALAAYFCARDPATVIAVLGRNIKPAHKDKARAALDKLASDAG